MAPLAHLYQYQAPSASPPTTQMVILQAPTQSPPLGYHNYHHSTPDAYHRTRQPHVPMQQYPGGYPSERSSRRGSSSERAPCCRHGRSKSVSESSPPPARGGGRIRMDAYETPYVETWNAVPTKPEIRCFRTIPAPEEHHQPEQLEYHGHGHARRASYASPERLGVEWPSSSASRSTSPAASMSSRRSSRSSEKRVRFQFDEPAPAGGLQYEQ